VVVIEVQPRGLEGGKGPGCAAKGRQGRVISIDVFRHSGSYTAAQGGEWVVAEGVAVPLFIQEMEKRKLCAMLESTNCRIWNELRTICGISTNQQNISVRVRQQGGGDLQTNHFLIALIVSGIAQGI